MRKTILISGLFLLANHSFGQVQSSARKTAVQSSAKEPVELSVNESDSVTVNSSGRFAMPVVKPAESGETQGKETAPVISSPARKPE